MTTTTQAHKTLIDLSDSEQALATDEIDFRDHSVIDSDGSFLGKVDDLLIDNQHHKVRMLRVVRGGFLGMGATKVFIPVDTITKITADGVYISHAADHVAKAPGYDPRLVDDRSYDVSLYGHYGFTPFWEPSYIYPAYLSSLSPGMGFGAGTPLLMHGVTSDGGTQLTEPPILVAGSDDDGFSTDAVNSDAMFSRQIAGDLQAPRAATNSVPFGHLIVGGSSYARSDLGSRMAIETEKLSSRLDSLPEAHAAHAHTPAEEPELRDELVAIAVHELKGPLTAILGFSQYASGLVRADVPNLDIVQHCLATIQGRVYAMTTMLEDLLDASRGPTAGIEIRKSPGGMGTNVSEVVSRLRPHDRQRIDFIEPANIPSGNWDQKRIEQVVSNLVDNALKYSLDDSRISITITCLPTTVEVAIRDRGVGIKPSDHERIFDRYYRTPDARASETAGTGIGLYLCRLIIEAHAGKLWTESEVNGEGSVFRFVLPYESSE